MQLNYYYYNVTFIYLDVIVYGMVYVFVISKTYSELFSLSYIYVHQAEKKAMFLRGLGIVDPLPFTSIIKKNCEHFYYSLSVKKYGYSFELVNYITLNLFPLPPPPDYSVRYTFTNTVHKMVCKKI